MKEAEASHWFTSAGKKKKVGGRGVGVFVNNLSGAFWRAKCSFNISSLLRDPFLFFGAQEAGVDCMVGC